MSKIKELEEKLGKARALEELKVKTQKQIDNLIEKFGKPIEWQVQYGLDFMGLKLTLAPNEIREIFEKRLTIISKELSSL